MSKTIYILHDPRVPKAVKVGKDSNWPLRLRQAQSHTPGGGYLMAAWTFDSVSPEALNTVEHAVQSSLPAWPHADCREWFAVPPADAVRYVALVLSRGPDVTQEPTILERKPYDDWRTLCDTKRDPATASIATYRRRIWIFRENSSFANLKLIHSIDFDCFFTYPLTYNPFPVRLVDCWQTAENFDGPYPGYAQGNRRIVALWEETLGRFGAMPGQRCCGWLPSGVTLPEVRAHLGAYGLIRQDLRAPKGRDCPYRGSSTKALPLGVAPKQDRVDLT